MLCVYELKTKLRLPEVTLELCTCGTYTYTAAATAASRIHFEKKNLDSQFEKSCLIRAVCVARAHYVTNEHLMLTRRHLVTHNLSSF